MKNQLLEHFAESNSPKTLSEKEFYNAVKKFYSYTHIKSSNFEKIDSLYSDVFSVPTLLGIEIEVEKVGPNIALPFFWKGKSEGSLRGLSAEFYSVPLTPQQAMYATALLYPAMKKLSPSGKVDFSWRTSIHHHLNILGITEDNLKQLILLTIIFEKILFAFAGYKRSQSVFCVPIIESSAIELLKKYFQGEYSLRTLVKERWQKYSAINLNRLYDYTGEGLPTKGLGTIEFRHLGGTNNLQTVLQWQTMLLKLFDKALKISPEELKKIIFENHTSQQYRDLVYSIFPKNIIDKLKIEDFSDLLVESCSKVKEILTPISLTGTIVKSRSSLASYAFFLHKKQKKKRKIKKHVINDIFEVPEEGVL